MAARRQTVQGVSLDGAAPTETRQARVGPNAILQLITALDHFDAGAHTRAVFARAGLTEFIDHPPTDMVEEDSVALVYRALFEHLDHRNASAIARDAGRRTADYVMANRIPVNVRRLLKLLPGPIAALLLLSAIARHAWTFAGSGTLSVQKGSPIIIEITANPLAIGHCAWHTAVFERMFRTLVSRHMRVDHAACCGEGAPSCRFEIATLSRIGERGKSRLI